MKRRAFLAGLAGLLAAPALVVPDEREVRRFWRLGRDQLPDTAAVRAQAFTDAVVRRYGLTPTRAGGWTAPHVFAAGDRVTAGEINRFIGPSIDYASDRGPVGDVVLRLRVQHDSGVWERVQLAIEETEERAAERRAYVAGLYDATIKLEGYFD